MSRITDVVGWVEVALAVLISLAGSWIVVKQDLARLEERVAYVEAANKQSIETNKELSKAITDLTVVLAEFRVEIGYLKEGVDKLER